LSSWINKEWKTTSKLAQVYVEKYKKITLENNIAVSFEKVKAHTGNIFNEIADKEAKKALGLNKSK
jgi:ribonuclease HI